MYNSYHLQFFASFESLYNLYQIHFLVHLQNSLRYKSWNILSDENDLIYPGGNDPQQVKGFMEIFLDLLNKIIIKGGLVFI